jgi:hypothetical protein
MLRRNLLGYGCNNDYTNYHTSRNRKEHRRSNNTKPLLGLLSRLVDGARCGFFVVRDQITIRQYLASLSQTQTSLDIFFDLVAFGLVGRSLSFVIQTI